MVTSKGWQCDTCQGNFYEPRLVRCDEDGRVTCNACAYYAGLKTPDNPQGKEITMDENIKYSGFKFEFVPECEGVRVTDPNSKQQFFFSRESAVSFYYFVKTHLNNQIT